MPVAKARILFSRGSNPLPRTNYCRKTGILPGKTSSRGKRPRFHIALPVTVYVALELALLQMSYRFTLLALSISIIFGAARNATAQLIVVSREVRALAVYAPPPQYPRVARLTGITGSGAAILNVDGRAGLVTSARMSPTTGDKDLDEAALKAFRQWRFKPGGASTVNVPIRFTMDRPANPPVTVSLRDAVYMPSPIYADEARSKHLPGIRAVLVDVDRTSGHVTAARILQSTAYRMLDEAALNAFRQWRFRPGTVSNVRIPISFLMPKVVPVVYE